MTFISMLPGLKRKVGGKAEIRPEGNIKSIMFEDCGEIGKGTVLTKQNPPQKETEEIKSISFFDL